jgi:hypothetical protein
MEYLCCCFRTESDEEEPVTVTTVTYNTFEPPKPVTIGKTYEIRVRNALRNRGIETLDQTAGSTNAHDVVIVHDGQQYGVEVKSKNATEGGQKMFQFRDGCLCMDDEYFKSLIGDYVPFKGEVPSFLKGDKSFETWVNEKHNFKGEYIPVGNNAVTRYYENKGSKYIYIESKGMYHTGEDPCQFGVPLFLSNTRIRIRCKQHGSSSVPGSVMASLVFKHPMEKSCFVLTDG